MASKLSVLGGLIRHEVSDLKNDLLGSSNSRGASASNEQDSAKARKEEQKREEAQRQMEEERRKRREKEEYQREKMRENIRQKYGIEKKTNAKPDSKTIQAIKKDYQMSDVEFEQFQQKVSNDQQEKMQAQQKIDKKLRKRQQKKELKKGVQESCKTQ